ncbi:immunoglobulin lambda-1 light chain-like [Alosa alosa]|uniref:immunoglobulin lambda-1 light chain-like n=1 Tax=Alosa alosa TaxID=278164 RepID=UPI0020151D81|nr:immunoglobulin lambda-1 light chain-like [Alosa alosa]
MAVKTASLTALIITLAGVKAIVLTQQKTQTSKLGQNVQIQCTKDNSGWTLSWYQQTPGSAPKFLLADGTRASGLPSRFTYTDNGYTEYLNINGVTADDEAVYYCAGVGSPHSVPYEARRFLYRHVSLWISYFGGGTKLTVADAHPPTPPELVLLAPSQDLSSGDRATVVCLAQGFYPDGATLTWSEEGKAVAGTDFQTGESKRQSDGTFSLSSVLTVQPERWRSGHTYTCQLSHSALSSPLTKSVAHGQCS